MKIWTAVVILTITLVAASARAGHARPLYVLAQRYEAAVEQFERVVRRVRGIDRADEQLVDRLDDAAARFRLAAKNPRHQNRLVHQWQKVQKLHVQVEQRIFGTYTPHHDLVYSWQAVAYQQSVFAEELFYHVENPRHGYDVRRISGTNLSRARYFEASTLADPPR